MQNDAFRLLDLIGKKRSDHPMSSWAIVTIDVQEEYRSGVLALPHVESAIAEGCKVLAEARSRNIPIIHVAHKGAPGAKTFASDSKMVEVVSEFQVRPEEPIVFKTLPNSFAGTTLKAELDRIGCKHLILFGFMTHMCVSTTARAAVDLGYLSTVVANASGTRNLPGLEGNAVSAQHIHQVALTELADRFAFVVQDSRELFAGI